MASEDFYVQKGPPRLWAAQIVHSFEPAISNFPFSETTFLPFLAMYARGRSNQSDFTPIQPTPFSNPQLNLVSSSPFSALLKAFGGLNLPLPSLDPIPIPFPVN